MRFASAQAVEVSAKRINFSVVRQVAERMSQRPSRERVRGITLVDKRNRGFKIEIVQVLVEAFDLACKQKSLINNALAAAAANIQSLARFFHQAAGHIKLNIESLVRFKSRTVEEHLADVRQRFASRTANLRGIHRHIAELENRHAFGRCNLRNFSIKSIRFERIFDKEHRHAITRRKFRVKLTEKLMRHRKQKTRTISGFRVSTCCTAVHESFKNGNSLQHNLVRGDIINIGDQADTAGVVFIGRIVKCLSVHKIPFSILRKSRIQFLRYLYAKIVPKNKNRPSIIEKAVKNVKERVFRGKLQ